jgi:dTDP-4-dehydrorhamnose 3,5-epimerase
MNEDTIKETEIKGVYVIKRPTFKDERGFFHEVFRKNDLETKIGGEFNPVQSNHSHSKKGVLRGVHRASWSKLVTVMSGKIQQIVVDLREDSDTFGKYQSFIISDDDPYAVYIPPFMGNAFLILSDEADYNYLVTDYWAPGKEIGVIYNDPDLGIKWEIEEVELSDKDKQNQTLKQAFPHKF